MDPMMSNLLSQLWDALDTEVFGVLDKHGVMTDNRRVRPVNEVVWLYMEADNVKEYDGFGLMTREELHDFLNTNNASLHALPSVQKGEA